MIEIRILVMSDEENDALLRYYKENHLDDLDIILSLGDLSYSYLQTVKMNSNAQLYYVKGNHDKFKTKIFDRECIEWKCIATHGIVIAGIGCLSRKGQILSEKEMEINLRKLYKKVEGFGRVDIVISHYPALNMGDGTDIGHKGYEAIKAFVEKTKPKYFIYGHNHLNYGRYDRLGSFGDTVLINAFEKYILDYK